LCLIHVTKLHNCLETTWDVKSWLLASNKNEVMTTILSTLFHRCYSILQTLYTVSWVMKLVPSRRWKNHRALQQHTKSPDHFSEPNIIPTSQFNLLEQFHLQQVSEIL
jgi:hypothetical protein